MAPCPESLARGLSPRSRLVLVAHLFGGRIDLRPIGDFASRHGLLLVEDAAQVFAGLDYMGHPAADVSLFSFGPIKTATALGGAIVRARDCRLLERMREVQGGWPTQRRRDFFGRVVKYAILKAVSSRPAYGAFVKACGSLGRDYDRLVNGSVRAFVERDFFAQLRRQPSAPLLSLLQRRLRRFDRRQIVERAERAEQIMGEWRGTRLFPGSACVPHAHWVLPVCVSDPQRLIVRLATAGYDATQGQSLSVVATPAGREELEPVSAKEVLKRIVLLPCYREMTPVVVRRLARLVAEEIGNEQGQKESSDARHVVVSGAAL
jgi:dTDP-4-amino-4,6-dideoxygalactose transaminase